MSKNRLLTFLGNEFGELVTSTCADRSMGTVFHRTKADIYSLLSRALHANSSCAAPQAFLLNYQVYELVNHQKSETRDQSMKLAFDVDKFVATVRSVAPDLWELVCEITQSVNERKGRSASVNKDSFASRIKHLRRTYIVSLIIFITNSECNSPFHTVLSDIIESCRGSTELNRSWHATSIQLVQPMPNTAIHSEQSRAVTRRLFSTAGEATTTESIEGSSSLRAHVPTPPSLVEIKPAEKLRLLLSHKRTERSSPIASPLRSTRSPHTKRACTFAEAAKRHSKNASDTCMEMDGIRQSLACNSSEAASTLQLESFQVTAECS